jgi:NAD(P)-dependent dehydrogenase (short-subunit alcohol dehydrogenase family)
MDRLAGKVALVTGGGSGLGEAICRRFAQEGATVIVNDLHAKTAQVVADEIGGHALAFDVADSSAVAAAFADVAQRFGQLDVLVNNAGIGPHLTPDERQERSDRSMQQFAEMQAGGPVTTFVDITVDLSDADWREMLAVHLDGTFYCTREALKIMNPQMRGAIVNMGSIMGSAGGGGAPHYCAAKAAIMGFTRSVAREVVLRNIRVNALAPGFIDTPLLDPLTDETRQMIVMQTPMLRLGEPDDIAWGAVYLASDEAKFVTGQVLSPNGGWHMSQ